MNSSRSDRREFLNSLGRVAVGGITLRGMGAVAISPFPPTPGRTVPKTLKAYGSGHFGEWIEDEFGLPAYRYTCDQITDPRAVTPVYTVWRSPTDQTHQVGNDRVVGAASNYGYVQVRQDEGSPKFLNDYSPERSQYGGGIGFLTDGRVVLSTFYPGNAKTFDRIFGVGYLRKKVAGSDYAVDQVIFAPFGDDPLLISQVTIANHGRGSAEIRWVEYWGCQVYQFSFRSWMQATIQGAVGKAADLRRKFGDRFAHHFRRLGDHAGLLETKQFAGRSAEDEHGWQEVLSQLASQWNGEFIEPAKDMPPGGWNNPFTEPAKDMPPEVTMEDLAPPPTFLVSLDGPADGFATNGKAFFGTGGVNHPAGLAERLDGDLASTGPESALLLERRLRLGPGESRTLYFAYGYLPEGFELNSLVEKYRKEVHALWEDSSRHWKADGLRFRVDSEPWVEREVTWHHYYLRSNLTYDSFFREHIESQGGTYQYIWGFQGSPDDAIQHTLPFVFSHPWIVKEVLRYTLKEVQPDGRVPYGIVGHGTLMPTRQLESIFELFVLLLASEYVLGTRDTAFLDETVATYPLYGPTAGKDTVRNLLARCYRHLVDNTGTGEHGLIHLLNCDSSDDLGLWHQLLPKHRVGEVPPDAESVFDSAMAGYVFDHYARLLNFVGDVDLAADARRRAEDQRHAVRAQWTGRWFRRAWLTPEYGWLGDEQMWLDPQPWAIVGGAATPEQTQALVPALDELLRRPSPIGAMCMSEGAHFATGVTTYGGVWYYQNWTLIWALALENGKMAWDEWKKNSLARHAEVYPEVWYGIWSGPDNYNSVLSKYPGQTSPFNAALVGPNRAEAAKSLQGLNWTDFPVMNMHPHSDQLRGVAKLLGVEFTEKGLIVAPTLPLDAYSFDSPLIGIRKSGGQYEGWYAPLVAGTWTVTVRLPAAEAERLVHAEVNGLKQALRRTADGALEFKGESVLGKPLRWSVGV
jgi:hypothetical protein